jgi:hypothetical protein
MKRIVKHLTLTLGFLVITVLNAYSMDHKDMHGDQGIPKGTVKGFTFEYNLMDMRENMKKMAGMHHDMDMNRTHHLMVSIKGPAKTVIKEVAYTVKGLDGKTATAKAMVMGSGYGADINLPAPGNYTIETRVTTSGEPVVHTFVYTLK